MKVFIISLLLVFSFNVYAQDSSTEPSTDEVQKKAVDNTEAAGAITEKSVKKTMTTADDSKESSMNEAQPKSFESVSGSVDLSYTCGLNNDERVISLVVAQDGSSGVAYKKNGEERTVAVAKNGSDYTRNVVERIKSNLEAANFTCESTSKSTDSTVDEATNAESGGSTATGQDDSDDSGKEDMSSDTGDDEESDD